MAIWFFGVKTPTDTLVEMMKFTLRRPDGSSRLDDVKCPVLVSGATQSLYLEPEETLRVFNALEHLGDNRREMWIGRSPEEGGLQAKIGAIGLSVQKTFQFLDKHLNIQRLSPSQSEIEQLYIRSIRGRGGYDLTASA